MSRTSLDLLVAVGSRLVQLPTRVGFLGGAATGLLVTDPAAPRPRATVDVDVIVDVKTYSEYMTDLAPALRALGAREDDSEGAPLCRWVLCDVLVDVMPTDSHVLGFANRWSGRALESATDHRLSDGTVIRLVDAPHFLATKIEAFLGRGKGDYVESKDIEDIIAVVDGRAELYEELRGASSDLRAFLADTFEGWLAEEAFLDAIPGHLPGDMDYGRKDVIARLLREFVALR